MKETFMKQLAAMLAVFTMVTFASHSQAEEAILLDQVMAIVNDDIVMQSELDDRVEMISSRLRSNGTAPPQRSVMEQRVLEQLILESIQLQLADRAGIRISDDQLNQALAGIARSNRMSLEDFEKQLVLEAGSYAEAREQIRREMVVSRIQQREVNRRVRVTDQEVRNFLESKEGRKKTGVEYKIGHILIAVPSGPNDEDWQQAQERAESVLAELKAGADFQQTAVAKSDGRRALEGGVIGWRKEDELPSIAANVLPVLGVGEPSELIQSGSGFHILTPLEKRGNVSEIIDQRLVRHILISPNEIRSDLEAEETIKKLRERIMEGEDFGDIAKSHSDDPVSAIDGGSLDWVSEGQMVPEFEAQMISTPLLEVSPVFRSDFGWHILQVMEVRQQDIGALKMEANARQVIQRVKYEQELAVWLQEVKSEAFIEVKDEQFKDLENG